MGTKGGHRKSIGSTPRQGNARSAGGFPCSKSRIARTDVILAAFGRPMTRPVYMLSGGITKFAKAHPEKDFRLMVKEAFDAALGDLDGRLTPAEIDGSVISYFSDHFTCQLK